MENSEIRVTVQKHSNVNQNADFSVLRFAKKRYGQITTYNSVKELTSWCSQEGIMVSAFLKYVILKSE